MPDSLSRLSSANFSSLAIYFLFGQALGVSAPVFLPGKG